MHSLLKKNLFKLGKFTFSLYFIFPIFFISNHAISRDVEPTYAFCATSGDPNFICPYLYENPNEIYGMYRSYIAKFPSISFRAVDYYPNPSHGTTNGLPTRYTVKLEDFRNNQWVDGGEFDLGARQPLCPQSNYPYMGVIEHNVTVEIWCIGYSVPRPDPDCEKCQVHVGNPIYPSSGIKVQRETDFTGSGSNELKFVRTYRSDNKGWSHNYDTIGVDFTSTTQTTSIPCYYDLQQRTNWPRCFKYRATGAKNDFMVQRSGRRAVNFGNDNNLDSTADVSDKVVRIPKDGLHSGFSVYNASDESTEIFDLTGRLQSVTSRSGRKNTFYYSDASTSANVASAIGLLIKVTDSFGHMLQFEYDSHDRMIAMIDSAGEITKYGYDEITSITNQESIPAGNLTSVTYPDGRKRLYWYNEPDKTSGANLPFALTGITDELGARFATFTYDVGGRATSTEHAGGTEKFTVSFPSLWSTSTVTDPVGTMRTYTFQTILGSSKNTGITQPGPGGVGTVSSSISYDSNGNVARATDFNGKVTTYVYDLARNLETSRVEALGTQQARTIWKEWHPVFRLPSKIAEPLRLTTFTYDTSGNVLTRTEQATSDMNGVLGTKAPVVGAPRIVRYSYNAVGQLLTETGPRSDVASTTSYTYDAQGNLSTIVDALDHQTTFQKYDSNGHVGRIIAATGVTTDLLYTPRGWLKQRVVSSGGIAETTDYDYDAVGQLKIVTLPDRSIIYYNYDDAHRLASVTDSVGNKVNYTYDLASNRILDQVSDHSNVLTGKITRVYDALNLLKLQTGGMQ